MSSFFGIFNRNGDMVGEKTANELYDHMLYWEPDNSELFIKNNIAIGHAMLWNTAESKYECLPLQEDTYILTMDARIDNRDELAQEIELPQRDLSEIGDSEFILGAYKKWGEECPKYLLGDFSFAILDEKKQQFFCARDHVGVKQFYYYVSKDIFLFGNDLKVLTQYPAVSLTLNDEAVANYLTNRLLRSDRLTFFESFQKLPPAHSLSVNVKGTKEICYWKLENVPKVELPNTEAYVNKLQELFQEAVYSRMRSAYTLVSHLSGGLDSSSIAVTAARKLKTKNQKLLAFNWVPEPTEEKDILQKEWSNSKIIAEREGIDFSYVTLTSEDIHKYRKKREVIYGDSAIFWEEYPVRAASRSRGARTILSGWGGDEFITSHGRSYYSDLFIKMKWVRLYSELKIRIKNKQKRLKQFMNLFYHVVVIPLVPRRWYCHMPRIECLDFPVPPVKKWFVPYIKKERSKPTDLSMQQQPTIRDDMLAYWNYGHLQGRIESWGTCARSMHLEYRFPLLDKRILEFAVSLPPEFIVHNGIRRYLFYLATKDLFPTDFKVQKISEPNRVERLQRMILSSYYLAVKETDILKQKSHYIDKQLLKTQLENIKIPLSSTQEKWTFDDIETAYSLLLSIE